MIVLSIVDHSRSARPSLVLNIYLSLTLLLDAAQARTLFLSSRGRPEVTYSSIFTAAVALKAVLLLLEAKHKPLWIKWDEREHGPEESSGVFSLGVFFWLNRMFRAGYQKVLTLDDLYPLDLAMASKVVYEEFCKHVDYAKLKGDKFGLAKVLVRTLRGPLLMPVLPRLALVGFTISQPLFLERLLDYLSKSELQAEYGYGFIGAGFLIYSGIAVSTAFYWYNVI